MSDKKKVFVTGAAGFIGMHLTDLLLSQNFEVVGIDNLKPSYGGNWSKLRKDYLENKSLFKIHELDLAINSNLGELTELMSNSDCVIHLAAWPGVRFSQTNPYEYSQANLNAFGNVLEAVKETNPNKFLFASSSSIYGDLGSQGAVTENQATGLNLKSFYAATKWSNELLAQQHQVITQIPTVALRFFTVFGEFGRPDMAYWNFLENTLLGQPINLYGQTGGSRNYTYVKDAVSIVSKLLSSEVSGYEAVNVSCGEPMETIKMLEMIGTAVGKKPKIEITARPTVDVEKTWADLKKIESLTGRSSQTPPDEAIRNFVIWYLKEVNQ